MSTDPEIQFGELEEEQPEVELRPDRNAHYAVVPYGEPEEGELPIFVDLDTLIEMESHALTDTSVELGGVMLGGQLHDDDGKPYVLVQDSVRAKHYEATKGSFKFTHDTWGQITRERDDFPDDWDMVGWYHTHPDWGVFLSGMDMFICDNFFNKPLDVALVIDPCRQDRGFFQWTGDPRERKRRVGGFYVIASRHRQAELEQFVAELEGGYTMRTDPNLRGNYGVTSGGGAPTVVNITEQRPGWMGQAIVGLMFMQTLMLLMIAAYFTMGRSGPQLETADQAARLQQWDRRLELKEEVLDEVVRGLANERDVVTNLVKSREEADRLSTHVNSYVRSQRTFERELQTLKSDLKKAEDEAKDWKQKYETKRKDHEAALAKLDEITPKDGETPKPDEAKPPFYAFFTTVPGIAVISVVLLFVVVASTMAMKTYAGQDEFPEEAFDDLPEKNMGPPHEGDGEFRLDDEVPGEDGPAVRKPPEEPPADEPPRG